MLMTEAQRRRAVRRARIPWSTEVADPRGSRGQRHGHTGLLSLMVVAFACGRVVLRRMEELSADLGRSARRALELPRKVSDSTLYRVLSKQSPKGLRQTVVSFIKGLIASKVIQNDLFRKGVMSLDGKSTWTSTKREVAGAKVSPSGQGGPTTYSFSSLRAVLTSSSARPCMDQELIASKEGESPAFREVFPRVCKNFGKLFRIVTGDAGLTCRENAELVTDNDKYYVFGLKGNQPTLHAAAERAFALCSSVVRARTEERSQGNIIVRELHTHSVHDAPDVDVVGAKQFWQVTQTTRPREGEPTVETRYFISSAPHGFLSPTEQLEVVRLHWGIENGHNWTMDMMLREDDRKPCQASKDAIEVICWLRIIAYNLLAAWRARAPQKDRLPMPWARAMELIRDSLVGSSLEAIIPTLA